nr:MAG TPA: anti-sigma factor [Caudoviricetes sp.]
MLIEHSGFSGLILTPTGIFQKTKKFLSLGAVDLSD